MDEKETKPYVFDQDDVRQHLNMVQEVVNRMAANSCNCKTWLITLLAALTALQIAFDKLQQYGWIIIAFIVMIWFLDAFYLMLERIHRDKEAEFIKLLKKDNWQDEIASMVYSFSTDGEEHKLKLTFRAMGSIACWPFYSVLIVVSVALLWGERLLVICHLL